MNSNLNRRATGWLLAGLLAAPAAVHAAEGVSIYKDQEAGIMVGMSSSDVERQLGRPAHVLRYWSAPGPTWTYSVIGITAFGMTEFLIDFGSDGKVISTGERVLGSSGAR